MRYCTGMAIGTYDLFHVGHLFFLKKASELCSRLIVAVDSDERVFEYKGHYPIIPVEQRMTIVSSIKCVDTVIRNDTGYGADRWKQYNIDVIFIGNNWEQNREWKNKESYLKENGIDTVYIPSTSGVSTTLIIQQIIAQAKFRK